MYRIHIMVDIRDPALNIMADKKILDKIFRFVFICAFAIYSVKAGKTAAVLTSDRSMPLAAAHLRYMLKTAKIFFQKTIDKKFFV